MFILMVYSLCPPFEEFESTTTKPSFYVNLTNVPTTDLGRRHSTRFEVCEWM
jgi:hypothetical protein